MVTLKKIKAMRPSEENRLPLLWGQISTTSCNATEVAQWASPSCSRPQPSTDNGVSDGRSNWLPVNPHPHDFSLYPEWPHRQCVGLAFRRSHDRGSRSAASLVICSPARIAVCNTWSSGDTALCRVGGATSQLDLPSLTPLFVAGFGWLQLGAPHWATSVNYCK